MLYSNKAVYTAYVAPSNVRDRRRDGPTDGRTDTPSYRVASARLKTTTATKHQEEGSNLVQQDLQRLRYQKNCVFPSFDSRVSKVGYSGEGKASPAEAIPLRCALRGHHYRRCRLRRQKRRPGTLHEARGQSQAVN